MTAQNTKILAISSVCFSGGFAVFMTITQGERGRSGECPCALVDTRACPSFRDTHPTRYIEQRDIWVWDRLRAGEYVDVSSWADVDRWKKENGLL